MASFRSFLLSAALLLTPPPAMLSQSITGRISGVLTDASGAAIPKAPVKLTYELTRQIRTFPTESNGSFTFTNLLPGDYTLTVASPGFSTYEQKGIAVGAQENVDLHEIRLRVGDLSSTVEVQSDVARVATDSSDRSVLVDRTTIDNTPLIGRDYLGVLRSLPGVQATDTNDQPAWNGVGSGINGGSSGQVLITLDGIASQNTGFGTGTNGAANIAGYMSPNVDAISEVRVMVSNYSAEYGARSGGQFGVSIKNGTARFHGSAYYSWRHEEFNANLFFNNKTGLDKPRYRYQNPGGTIGGPVLIPGTNFNKSRTKLFFFYSVDYFHSYVTGGASRFTMPTKLERAGDFSQTQTTTGRLIPIKDPATGAPYPGNIMPLSQTSPTGRAMMNLFPVPFTSDPTGQNQYNTQYQFNRERPHTDQILRLDYNLGPRTTSYVRLIHDNERDTGVGCPTGGQGLWGQFSCAWIVRSSGVVATVVHTFRPNLINEFTYGVNTSQQHVEPADPAAFQATNTLSSLKDPISGQVVSLPKIFDGNYLNILPNIYFTNLSPQSAGQGVTNAPAFTFESRYPFNSTDRIMNIMDNVTWVKSGHTTKFGFYLEHCFRPVTAFSNYSVAGTYYFGSDIANPNDTGYAFSNMLRGTTQAFGQDNKKQITQGRYNQVEWFVQDSWKVSRRITLDIGMRFQIMQPAYNEGATLGFFDGASYDPSKSGTLLFPAVVKGQSVAVNPKTGASYQFARRGFFDPVSISANGSPYSGILQYQSKFFHTPHVLLAPRVGFAWDVFGNGKTALRGGFGIFYDRPYTTAIMGSTGAGVGPMAAPPGFLAPTFYNTTFTEMQTAQAWYGPQTVVSGSQDFPNPTVYNWSFGIQRNLGHGVILDAAYIGNTWLHGFGTASDANAIPPLTTWTPDGGLRGTPKAAYLDPTSSGGGTGAFYATDLIRAMLRYQGYSSISTYTTAGRSNYNALQVQANRRFAKRLQVVSNYTWSKTLVYARQQWISDALTKNVVNRPHAVNLTVGLELPNGSRLWSNGFTKRAFDGWRVNGVGSFFSGTPLSIGCTSAAAPIGWPNGTPTGGIPLRCQMTDATTAGLWLPPGTAPPSNTESRLWYPVNANNFVLPSGATLGLGNTPPTLTYGPGFENIDMGLSKEFRVAEGKRLEFKAEAFNILNHFNPGNPNTSLTRNFTTGANTNANFGVITTAQNSSRRMAMTLRFRF